MAAPSGHDQLRREFENLYEDCNYTSLTYFNAAKSADFWGKAIVFWPAVVSSIASLLVSLNQPKQWSALSAIASAIVATASYLGANKRADPLKDSAKKLTVLRHKVRLELALVMERDAENLETLVRDMRSEYAAIVSANELVPDRFFKRSQRQMQCGVLEYAEDVNGEGGATKTSFGR
ncbi:hypothetical protein [Plantactinospora sp. CA-290183]|uniref:hypothetical protein n=1 Tax=Plantactinospora sp. CA-290183 TaxID=3240006 RepID=UPI003D90C6E2